MIRDVHTTKLKEGDNAPDFTFSDAEGNPHTLKDFKGKKIALYFYPKDSTPGCTAEACNLRDNYSLLKKQGYEVIGVSADTDKSHAAFASKYKLPFTLIPNTGKEIIKEYDVWGKKKFMGRAFDGIIRTTFIIDEQGKIEKVIRKVETKKHSEQILTNNI